MHHHMHHQPTSTGTRYLLIQQKCILTVPIVFVCLFNRTSGKEDLHGRSYLAYLSCTVNKKNQPKKISSTLFTVRNISTNPCLQYGQTQVITHHSTWISHSSLALMRHGTTPGVPAPSVTFITPHTNPNGSLKQP